METKVPFWELLKADLDVGARYHARSSNARLKAWLRWVLDFSEKDLSKLTTADWLNVRYQMGALSITALPHHPHLRMDNADDINEWLEDAKQPGGPTGTIPSMEECGEIQKQIRTALDKLLTTGRANLGSIKVNLIIFRNDKLHSPTKRHSGLVDFIQGGTVERAIYQISALLKEQGAMIEKCPECERRFLADRTNQKYCSGSCQSKVTSRNYRQKEKLSKKERKVIYGKSKR
jgi:hypothetical protein